VSIIKTFFKELFAKPQIKIFLLTLFWLCVAYAFAYVVNWVQFARLPSINDYVTSFARGDTGGYLDIAKNGYQTVGDAALNLVFYPLYPIAIKAFSFLFVDFQLSGFMVTIVSIFISTQFFSKLVKIDYSNKVAFYAISSMLLFPFSIFMLTFQTESFFIMLSIVTAYQARKGNWILAGLFGFLTALTRTQGLLIFILVIYELIYQSYRSKKWTLKGLAILFIPMGTGVYLIINKVLYNNFFQFLVFQEKNWHQQPSTFWASLCTSFNYSQMPDWHLQNYLIFIPQIILFFFTIVVLLYGLKKKVRTSYIIYSLAFLIYSYSPSWLLSGGRYLSCLFPLFIIFGVFAEREHRKFALMLTTILLFTFFGIAYLCNFGIW